MKRFIIIVVLKMGADKNEVKKLCDDINELLERKISGYINNN